MADEVTSEGQVSKEAFERRLKEIEDLKAQVAAHEAQNAQAATALLEVNQRMGAENFLRAKGVADPSKWADLALSKVLHIKEPEQFTAEMESFYDTYIPATPEPQPETAPVPGVASPSPSAPGVTPASEINRGREWLGSRSKGGTSIEEYLEGRKSGRIEPDPDVANAVISR